MKMVNRDELIKTFVEVQLFSDEDFLKIKETLTRIGIPSKKEKKLFQTCHILHKKGKYYIVHFKELFALDGRKTTLDEYDIKRRNLIANLLDEWGLCKLVDPEKTKEELPFNRSNLVVLKHSEKDWVLEPKYKIGRKAENVR